MEVSVKMLPRVIEMSLDVGVNFLHAVIIVYSCIRWKPWNNVQLFFLTVVSYCRVTLLWHQIRSFNFFQISTE